MFLLTSLLALTAVYSSVTDCNTSSIFRPTMLSLTPDPPVIGEPIHMTVQFENPGPAVTEGIATTTVTVNGFPFNPKVEDLCQNTACPLLQGADDRSTDSTWPNVAGKIVSRSVWKTAEGDELLCVQASVKIGEITHGYLNLSDIDLFSLFKDDISQKRLVIWKRYFDDHAMCPAIDYQHLYNISL